MRRGQVQKTLGRAKAYLKKGRREKALEDYRKVLAIDPENETARQMVEQLQSSETSQENLPPDEPERAGEGWEVRDIEAIIEAAIVHTRSKEYNRAIGELGRALSIDPHRASAYYRRARVYALQGAHGKAVHDFEKAIELEPTPDLYYQFAAYYATREEYKQAIAWFSKAIELKPDFFDAWLHRSMAYGNIDEQEQAKEDCRRALELRPDDVAAKMVARMLARST